MEDGQVASGEIIHDEETVVILFFFSVLRAAGVCIINSERKTIKKNFDSRCLSLRFRNLEMLRRMVFTR